MSDIVETRNFGEGRFAEWSTEMLSAQCRMQARDSLDPDFMQFMEAVAVRLAAAPDAAASAMDDPDHQYAVVSSNYSRPFLVGAYPTLDAALLAQGGKPDRWHIYRRLSAAPDAAASETGEVARLREALTKARNWLDDEPAMGPSEAAMHGRLMAQIDAALTTQGGAER